VFRGAPGFFSFIVCRRRVWLLLPLVKTLRAACAVLILLLVQFVPIARAAPETGKLAVRVTDAQTGQLLPARLSLQASDGTYPADRIGLTAADWPHVEAHGVFIPGEGTFDLPPGKTKLIAGRGPQYLTDAAEVEIVADKSVTVELKLKRFIDLRKLGWVCGDAHVHMIHGEMQRQTSYPDLALTCRANGLDWAYVNQEYGGAGKLDLAGYKAECAKVSDGDFSLLIGGERPKSLLGHNVLIGVDDPFLIPEDPPYHAAARIVHAQGGVLFPVHPVRYFPEKKWLGKWSDFPGNNLGRELIFDAYAGPSFDGVSVLSDEPDDQNAHQLWFNLLNRGFYVPVFADSDACFDRPMLSKNVPGFWATYLYVGPGGKSDNPSLAQAVRQGRTMATTGPLLLLSIDRNMSGSTIPSDGKPHAVNIDAHHSHHNWTLATSDAKSGTPEGIAKVELIRNGVVVKSWEPAKQDVQLSWSVTESSPCWYAARAYGSDGRWQVALASPIYFAPEPVPAKRPPLMVHVQGRIYDFVTGKERDGAVTVHRGGEVLKQFAAGGNFTADMPLDAEISVAADGAEPLTHDLLLDYAPVHKFLWNLKSADMGKPQTLDAFEALVKQVDLEFPLGYRMAGCYPAATLAGDAAFESVRVLDGPPPAADGTVAVAAVLLDKRQASAGDTINIAAIFRDERGEAGGTDMLLVVDARAYDPARPTGFGQLKLFSTFETNWSKARDVGQGYRMISGKITLPTWARPGPTGAIDLAIFSRIPGGPQASHLGLQLPLGKTSRSLMACSAWPTSPISWPDQNYGIGPLKLCGRNGRTGQPRADYRSLHLSLKTFAGDFDVLPTRDCHGCPAAANAVFTTQFLDQILNDESHLVDEIRDGSK
jgi:hypothetical protein